MNNTSTHSRPRSLFLLHPAIALCLCISIAATSSCSDDKNSYVANLSRNGDTPTMITDSVVTMISDSGYTRYRITTPLWLMYEEAPTPYWSFPQGLVLDHYDLRMQPIASMVCDSATYFSQDRIWRLDGNVVMVNTQRDSFLTQQVYWDQMRREVYSDSFVHIVKQNRILEGYGFTSNQNMTAYSINNPTAILPVDRNRLGTAQPADSTSDNIDAARRATPIRASERAEMSRMPDKSQVPIALP